MFISIRRSLIILTSLAVLGLGSSAAFAGNTIILGQDGFGNGVGVLQQGDWNKGQILQFHHKNSGKQVQDSQTLSQAGVRAGDILRLQPEITAG